MTRSDETRQARHGRAIIALMTHATIEQAALACGVTSRSMQRWMREEAFKAMLQDAQTQALETTARRLAGLSGQAVSTLSQVMDDTQTPAGVRSRSADLILANAIKYQETVALAQRVKRLEDVGRGGNHAETTSDAT